MNRSMFAAVAILSLSTSLLGCVDADSADEDIDVLSSAVTVTSFMIVNDVQPNAGPNNPVRLTGPTPGFNLITARLDAAAGANSATGTLAGNAADVKLGSAKMAALRACIGKNAPPYTGPFKFRVGVKADLDLTSNNVRDFSCQRL